MDMIDIIVSLLKYTTFLFALLIIYIVYKFIYKPYTARLFYKKFPNIVMSKKFVPFLGEHTRIKQAAKENKYRMSWIAENKIDNPHADIALICVKDTWYYHIMSPQAVNEFLKHVPHKIDRYPYEVGGVSKLCTGAFSQIFSNQSWKQRRESIFKFMGINYSSKFIPLILKITEERTNTWKDGEQINFYKEAKQITFKVITSILFGEEFLQNVGQFMYKTSKGDYEKYGFEEFFFKAVSDTTSARFAIKNVLFPFLIKYNLLEPNRTIKENADELHKGLKAYFETNSASDSVYAQVQKSNPELNPHMLL